MDRFEKLKSMVMDAQEDFDKFFEKENQAAGTRVRKIMQELKEYATELRKEVQEIKNSKKEA